MKKYCLMAALCASFLMSGCDHYTTKMAAMEQSNSDISAIAPASGGETMFSDYLATQYYQLASYEQNITRDYPAAKAYFMKAEALSKGQMVALNDVRDYKLEGTDLVALTVARREIEAALQTYRTPENRYALALAHSRYDCWLDEAEEGKELSSCKVEFKQAMNSLIEPYDIYSEEEFYDDLFDVEL